MESPKRGRPRGRTVGAAYTVRLPDDLREALQRRILGDDRAGAGVMRNALRRELEPELAAMRRELAADLAAAAHQEEAMVRAS